MKVSVFEATWPLMNKQGLEEAYGPGAVAFSEGEPDKRKILWVPDNGFKGFPVCAIQIYPPEGEGTVYNYKENEPE